MRVPKGSVEDCLLYDNAEEYKYVRLTECDDQYDYMVVGGCDHKVGQEETTPRFDELEQWTRERFPQAGSTDYKWSGQIFEPVDYMGFIGKNQGNDKIYIITGDSGDGLTHGTLAGRLLADEIDGIKNPWADLYNPKRVSSILKSLPSMISHDVQINAQYKRFLQSDIQDIEDLPRGCGGVLNKVCFSLFPFLSFYPSSGHQRLTIIKNRPTPRSPLPYTRTRTATSRSSALSALILRASCAGTMSRRAGTAPFTARVSPRRVSV